MMRGLATCDLQVYFGDCDDVLVHTPLNQLSISHLRSISVDEVPLLISFRVQISSVSINLAVPNHFPARAEWKVYVKRRHAYTFSTTYDGRSINPWFCNIENLESATHLSITLPYWFSSYLPFKEAGLEFPRSCHVPQDRCAQRYSMLSHDFRFSLTIILFSHQLYVCVRGTT